MKVLILGGSGLVGARLAQMLAAEREATPIVASRNPGPLADGIATIRVDALDSKQVSAAVSSADIVVNSVMGDTQAMADGAKLLTQICLGQPRKRIIQLSSMAVYGDADGDIDESRPMQRGQSAYGDAKIAADQHMIEFARQGGECFILRPGCIYGPGSKQWVLDIAQWLRNHRLGDIGAYGDGWSNLIHVDDVARAVIACLKRPAPNGVPEIFNLAAPDSPRWNRYFIDLGIAIGATPVSRLGARRVQLERLALAPVLKIAEKLLSKFGCFPSWIPRGISPSLWRLWSRDLRLSQQHAAQVLGIEWTPYHIGVETSARWFLQQTSLGASKRR